MPDPIAFVSFVMLTTFTPGPNNIMSMSNAARHGFRRTLAFTAGVCAGFFAVVGVSIVFTVALYRLVPTIKPVMTLVGALYILWLAWRTLRASAHDDGAPASSGFVAGMLLQFLNPKAILYGLTAASTFIVPYYRSTLVLVGFAAALAAVSFVSTSAWAAFGSVFQRFFATHERVVGWVMAALLVACAVSLYV